MAGRGDFTERTLCDAPQPNVSEAPAPVETGPTCYPRSAEQTLRLAGREQKRQEGARQMQDHAPPRFPGADAGSRGFGDGSWSAQGHVQSAVDALFHITTLCDQHRWDRSSRVTEP
jgi:hypothetical protein